MSIRERTLRRYDVTRKKWTSYNVNTRLGVPKGQVLPIVSHEGDEATLSLTYGEGKRNLLFSGAEHITYEREMVKEDAQLAVALIMLVITLGFIVYFQ